MTKEQLISTMPEEFINWHIERAVWGILGPHLKIIDEILSKKNIEHDWEAIDISHHVKQGIGCGINEFLIGKEENTYCYLHIKDLLDYLKGIKECENICYFIDVFKDTNAALDCPFQNMLIHRLFDLFEEEEEVTKEDLEALRKHTLIFLKENKEDISHTILSQLDLDEDTTILIYKFKLDRILVKKYDPRREYVNETFIEDLYIHLPMKQKRVAEILGVKSHFTVEEVLSYFFSHPHLNGGMGTHSFCLGTAPISNYMYQDFPSKLDTVELYLYWGGFIEELLEFLHTESSIGVPYTSMDEVQREKIKLDRSIKEEYSNDIENPIPEIETYELYNFIPKDFFNSSKRDVIIFENLRLLKRLGVSDVFHSIDPFANYLVYNSNRILRVDEVLNEMIRGDLFYDRGEDPGELPEGLPYIGDIEVTREISTLFKGALSEILFKTLSSYILQYGFSFGSNSSNFTTIKVDTDMNLLYSRLSEIFNNMVNMFVKTKLYEEPYFKHRKYLAFLFKSRACFVPINIKDNKIHLILPKKENHESNLQDIINKFDDIVSSYSKEYDIKFKGEIITQSYDGIEEYIKDFVKRELNINKIDKSEDREKEINNILKLIDFAGINPVLYLILLIKLSHASTKSKEIIARG